MMGKYPGLGLYHAWTEIIDEKSRFHFIQASWPEYESAYSLLWNRWSSNRAQFIGDFLFEVSTLKRNGGFYKLPLAWCSDEISAMIAAREKEWLIVRKLYFNIGLILRLSVILVMQKKDGGY